MDQVKSIRSGEQECIAYCDVKVLSTSMPIQHIISLLEICLRNTYFLLQSKYYEQMHGVAMGSPISPFVANLFMEV